MTKPTLHLISGLPRAGSTLLCNILAQNPKIHVGPTNGLLQILNVIKENWTDITEFKTQGLNTVTPRIRTLLKGAIEGFYADEINKNLIIFDKDRGWVNDIELIEEVLGVDVKIIVNVRDIKDIVASFEKLTRKNPLLKNHLYGDKINQQSIYSRSNSVLVPGGVIGRPYNSIIDAFTKGYESRLLIVPFTSLTTNPEIVMNDLMASLDMEPFEYSFTNMTQILSEDDSLYGLPGLHDIKLDVTPIESTAIETLGPQICSEIDESYKALNQFI